MNRLVFILIGFELPVFGAEHKLATFRAGFIRHCAAGVPIQLTSPNLGEGVCLPHVPGESFIEYQVFT